MDNILEAKECYILMKKEYRISRNIRAEWYLNRINSTIKISRKNSLDDFHGELDVISVLPLNPTSEWDSDTAHEYEYLITARTQLYFLSQKYRLVLCLDLSPSLSVPNFEQGKIVFEEVFPTLERCLKGIIRPFVIPGSQILFFPKIYVTIIAHTPFFKSQPQVIVQGWLLFHEKGNLESFLRSIHLSLIELQNQLAKLTKESYSQVETTRVKRDSKGDNCASSEDGDFASYGGGQPMVSPDIGFVNMLRYGIVALQLLPQNSMAGIIVITDGIISLPDATMFDSLLVQLRNLTISCSFLQIGTVYQPHTGLGYIPFNDLMVFLANATCGVYFTTLPQIKHDYDNEINEYHKSFLMWRFQKAVEENGETYPSAENNSYFRQGTFATESSVRIRKQERKSPLRVVLSSVLSCRLREGYTIKDVRITTDHIELILVLAWKYSISIEYHIHSVWPPTQSEVQTEVWIEASYEFLNDVSDNDPNFGGRSHYRQRMVAKYLSTLKDLRETDLLLVNLQSFPLNPHYYTIPDCVQKGIAVFYVNPHSNSPFPVSDFQDQYPQFANFWLPIYMLNINKWQKWMHTHRISIILRHETPLPKNLHITNSSGRFGTVHSRHSELTLTSFLANWADFTLIESNSYIKYLFNNEDDPTPSSFFVVRITSNRPPCLAIRLAFLGGTSCRVRDKNVGDLQRGIQQLSVRIRERSRERKGTDHLQERVSIRFSDLVQGMEVAYCPKTTGENQDQNVNTVLCCSITHKPIEKILIWYDRIPCNLLSSQVQDPVTRFLHHRTHRLGTSSKSASDHQSLLRRYLHHRRWIWGLKSTSNPSLPTNAIMKILDTLTRMRLHEGFKFAYSRNGILTMVKEFEMKLDLNSKEGQHLDAKDMASHCTVQYILFPPHFGNLKGNLEEDTDEIESIEADVESQLITECWVEPQNGVVQEEGDTKGLHYEQLAASFFHLDRECIWGLITFECLTQFGQDSNQDTFTNAPNLFLDESSPLETPEETGLGSLAAGVIQQIPFHFHVTHLLPRCQRAEILLFTLFQDFHGFLVNPSSRNKESDRTNHILYSLILDHLNQLHNGKQFHLSSYDNCNLPQILSQRPRELQHGTCPLAYADIGSCSEVPKWRCFIKYISQKHFLITLVPSSYLDLKLLVVNRANILGGQTKAVQLVDKPEGMSLIEKMDDTFFPTTTPSDRVTFSSSVTEGKKVASPSQHQHSFTSTSSNFSSCRSSSIPQDPGEKSPSRRQLFSSSDAAKPPDEEAKRTRYRSGPPLSTFRPCPVESVDDPESSEPRRERAFSLYSNLDNATPQRPSPPSLGAHNKEEIIPVISRERVDTWASSGSDKYRKRNISMPSKCHKEMVPQTIYNKSLSAEAMKENESKETIFHDADNTPYSSTTDSPQQPSNHIPLYGAATLPIFCFDCNLSSIVNQYMNKDSKELEIGKDLFMDSTSKADNYKSDPCSSPDTRHPDETPVVTSLEATDKDPSPEPLSEESDTLAADSKFLKSFMESVEKCHRKSFVMGVFEALSNDLFVHSSDVQAALDQCQEVFLETDITNYLEIICGHLKDFRTRFCMKQKRHIDSFLSFGPEKLLSLQLESSEEILPPVPPFPLSLLNEHQPCKDRINHKFSEILQTQFKPVPTLPKYYYYSPKATAYSQVENNKYKYWSLMKRKAKKKSEEESLNEIELIEGEDDDEEKEKSIEFRSEDGSYVAGPQRFMSQISHLSQMSGFSVFEDGNILEENDSDEESHPPLFLHLTCTIRRQHHTVGTVPIGSLPACLGHVTECFKVPDVDLSEVSVTLDILVITLLGGADICPEDVQEARRGRRTISGCSTVSSVLRLSESTANSYSGSDEMYVEDDLLNHLPDDQHKAIFITFERIKSLIQDEIVSSLLSSYPITEEMLQLVASHVANSSLAPNCHLETVPLKFVSRMEKSFEKFMEEFKNMRIDGYQLRQIGNFYFLTVLPDSARKPRLFSLVPPLMLKGNPLDFRLKSMKPPVKIGPSVESRVGSPEEQGTSLRKTQKVSFEANALNDAKARIEESSSEMKKEKWNKRRERKERRDSEKRGMPESSDSAEDETTSAVFVARDSSSQNNDSKDNLQTSPENPVSDEIEKEDASEFLRKIDENVANKLSSEKIAEKELELQTKPGQKSASSSSASTPGVKAEGEIKATHGRPQSVHPIEILSPKPLELIRCGSVSLPHIQAYKTDAIRKSASTDAFSPTIHGDAVETPKGTPLSGQSSTEGSKYHSEYSQSRHSSGAGGDVLKSRHNSGTGSILGMYSDVSSLLESGQNTEDGCEGDISDSDDCTDWMQDFDVAQPQPPDFWLVIKIDTDLVHTYFHCRLESEVERWRNVHRQVVKSLREQVKLVNQRLLLQNLNECRMCDHLLEPETSEDAWKLDDSKDLSGETNEYLEAAMKFKLGAFACGEVWSKRFELHPRLKTCGKGVNKGIQTLKKTLNPFMVTNRKNMFVYEDHSGIGPNVFYLRLNEQSCVNVGPTHVVDNRRDDSLSRSSSITSLPKRGVRDEDAPSQSEPRRSFVDKDVIMEGIASASALRKNQDAIILSVHGIAEPGVAITEKLVQMLQKKLDDAVLDAICLMLWDNPHHKLTAEDVHFIQPPGQPPSRIVRFSVNSFALPYIPATCYYMSQNMLHCGFTPPKYTDTRPEHHFQDISATDPDPDPTSETNIFLFVCSQKSGTKGVACLASSVVDVHGKTIQPRGCPKLNMKGYEDLVSESDFESLTKTVQQLGENETGCGAMFQFKVWEAGRLDFDEIAKCLEEAIRHALWDLNMECRFLLAPLTPSCLSVVPGSSQPTTPVKGTRPFGSPRNSIPMYERSSSPLSYNQIDSICKITPRSPSKFRHSVDLGKEHILPRLDTKLIAEDIGQDEFELSSLPDSPPEVLHSVFSQFMLEWLELGVELNVPAVRKHVIICPTSNALPVFLMEIQRWLHFHLPDATTKGFKRSTDSSTYTKIDVLKMRQLLKSRKCYENNSFDLIITNRNEKQWWTILFEKDVLEVSSQVLKGNKTMKFNSLFVPHMPLSEGAIDTVGNGSYLSSPTSLVTLAFSDSTPQTQSQFKFGESSTSHGLRHRQIFLFITLVNNKLTIYCYNWMKDLNEMLSAYLNRLCHWTSARTSLLSSLVLQKMGLFHNQPFVRRDVDLKEDSHKKEAEKKEETNPFVQNLAYMETLIKSEAPERDILPTERSSRRNQPPPSLHNFSGVLRNSAPSKPLHKQHQQKKGLWQRHWNQMVDVTRANIQKGKERKFLQSMMQNPASTTPVFNDVTLTLFKKHARAAHFCFTPLLFLPKWRAEVAAVRDHSFPDVVSSEHSNQNKGTESRSRHESGTSVKLAGTTGPPHLELRRSSSVGLPPGSLAAPSPSHSRKRHSTLGGEDKWHEALCLIYQKEFIQYLHCLVFETVCLSQSQQSCNDKSVRGAPSNVKEEVNREMKPSDQDMSSPTFLVRHCFGGTVLLQINFAEPYFGAIVYILEGSRTQHRKQRNKCQSNSFIDEVELIRLHLHMHSFTYDYHLRAVCVYVADRQLLFARGYHLSSFLSDFIKYYSKSPNCARNLIQTGVVRIEDTGTPGELLYNYLLAREKEYEMRVLRMTPIIYDATSDRYTEFVLAHTKSYCFPFDDECEQRDGDDYDVTLLVSHDTNASPEDVDSHNTLYLRFYVILTCRRDMYPNRNSEGKSGKFRTVSTANTMDQLKGNTNLASSSTSSLSSGNGVNTKSQGSSTSKTASISTNTSFTKSSHVSIRDESVNYLSYYSEYQIYMQQILQQQVVEARERIVQILDTAKIHCRRDTLWQKLMQTFKEEEKARSTKDQTSHTLSFSEFTELLNLVSVRSISTLDPQLMALVSKPISWYQSLTRLLYLKYQDNPKYGLRVLTSSDVTIQYVVVYNLSCPDACIMISQNSQIQRADICCLTKFSENDSLDSKIKAFLQDFVNCCCFHLWSGLL